MSAGDSGSPEKPSREPTADRDESLLTRFRTAETGPLMFVREVLTSMAAVALVGLVLFAISGVWPPMVAVESGSMVPHMQKGDLVFVTESGRFMPSYADDAGVVPYRTGKTNDYRTFGSYGSVVVYDNPQRAGPPVIHRARFHVERGENWYGRANPEYIRAGNCRELPNCPAPHDGYITKGDANPTYDQVNGISSPVKQQWIVGVARVRIPYLGWVRLGFTGAAVSDPTVGVAGLASATTGNATDENATATVAQSASTPAGATSTPAGTASTAPTARVGGSANAVAVA